MGDLLEDVEFSRSLGSVSLIVLVVEFTFGGLGGESSSSVLELLLVLLKSSLLVDEGSVDFFEFSSVSGKLSFGGLSESSNFDHEVVKINLSLDFSFDVITEEGGEIDLELFEETDALVESGTIKG